MRFLSALKQDLQDAFHWRPFARTRRIEAELAKLAAGVDAAQQYANHLEMRLNNDAFNALRIDRLEDQLASMYLVQVESDSKQVSLSSQVVEFGNELEKMRLRLAVPVAEQAPDKPKTWAERKKEYEQKYAKESVVQEITNAGKGKPS